MARDRVFAVSLGVSLLFHLSMVTVFSIVIFFPRRQIKYYSFRIVEARVPKTTTPDRRDLLRVPSADQALDKARAPGFDEEMDVGDWASLPEIRLPELRFAELELLRAREKGLALRPLYDGLVERKPRDSWARFGEELGSLSSALSRLAPPWRASLDVEDQPTPVSRHAAGFEFYVEWMSEPKDRQLIFAPPIEALWRADPAQLDLPITLIFKVNPDGKVVGGVLTPLDDEAGVVRSAAKALTDFRFEPLDPDQNRDQRGTLLITAAKNE